MALNSVFYLPGTSEIKGVDQGEGEGSGHTSGKDVGTEFHILGCVFLDFENSFDGILKGKVEGLCGEISQHIGQVT